MNFPFPHPSPAIGSCKYFTKLLLLIPRLDCPQGMTHHLIISHPSFPSSLPSRSFPTKIACQLQPMTTEVKTRNTHVMTSVWVSSSIPRWIARCDKCFRPQPGRWIASCVHSDPSDTDSWKSRRVGPPWGGFDSTKRTEKVNIWRSWKHNSNL